MKSLQESLFDPDLTTNTKISSLLDLVKGRVNEVRLPYGLPLIGMIKGQELSDINKQYNQYVLPTKRFANRYKKDYGVINSFLNWLLSKVVVSNLNNIKIESRWFNDYEIEEEINKISKYKMKAQRLVCGNDISFAFMWADKNSNAKQSVINLFFDRGVGGLLSKVNEGIFDKNLSTEDITTLYNLFGNHIKKYQHTYGGSLGWTHFFNQPAVVREWKKEGKPMLSGGFAKTTFPPDLQKFIAVILNNTIVTKQQIIKMSEDGIFDERLINGKLDDAEILLDPNAMWGASHGRHQIKVQVGYIEWDPSTPEHGAQYREVGTKRYKGLNTDKIEISIYAYDPKHPGFGCHIWTVLTDLSINDLKK